MAAAASAFSSLKMGSSAFCVSFSFPLTPTATRHQRLKVYCSSAEMEIVSAGAKKQLPPGPLKLPLIGNLHNLVGSEPHHALRDLAREYGPLMHLQLGEVSAAIISSPKMAQEVMKTQDLAFAQRPEFAASKIMTYGAKDIAFSPLGEYWKQMRKICLTELLGPRRVQAFADIRRDEVSSLLKSVQSSAGRPFNFTEKVFTLTSIITCRAAFGNKCNDRDAFLSLAKEAGKLAGGFDIVDLFPSMEFLQVISGMKEKLERIHEEMDTIFDNIIREHIETLKNTGHGSGESGEDDLVDVFLRLQAEGSVDSRCPMASNSIKAVIMDLFIAGTDTSSTTVEWAMSEMMRNPRILKKLQAEIRQAFKGKETIEESDIHQLKYLKAVVKETLRLHPPAPLLLPRESTKDTVIDGYQIPLKTKMIVNAWAIGRDADHWENPESFIPERFENSSVDFKGMDFEFIPFGAGRRICPGISFGIANIEVPLAQLLYHFNWRLPDGVTAEKLDMTENFGATVGRKNNLCLVATPYKPPEEESSKQRQ